MCMSKTWKNEYSKPQKSGHGKKWRLHWGFSQRRLRPYGMNYNIGYGGEFYRPGKRNPYYKNLGYSPGEMIFSLNNKPKERQSARWKIYRELEETYHEISEELWKLEMSGENFDALEYEDFALWIRLGRMLRMFKDDDI